MKKWTLICLLVGELFASEAKPESMKESSFNTDERKVLSSEECQWVYEQMEVYEAWEHMRSHGIQQPGKDITIAHLDTGIIPIDSLLFTRSSSNGHFGLQIPDAKQQPIPFNLVQSLAEPWDNDPKALSFGHGTSTASLIIGWMNNTAAGGLSFRGIAPWLRLLPIKVTDSVVMVGNMSTSGTADLKNLAKGIGLATQLHADVITISLGALFDPDNLLKNSVNEALDQGSIIIAAAGQTFPVNMIPLPARLPGVIAVSASSKERKPWNEAFVGKHISWTAPGADVCHVKAQSVANSNTSLFTGHPIVQINSRRGDSLSFTDELVASSGTSYSTAFTAAAAALWLQFHSPSELRRLYGRKNISSLFSAVAKRFAMDTPPDWQRQKHGEGILNIRKLIQAPLPCSQEDSRESCDVKTAAFLNFSSR